MKRFCLIALLLAACGKDSSGPATFAVSLSVASGNAQVDTVTQTLPLPIEALATDTAIAKAAPGVVVNWFRVVGTDTTFLGAQLTNDSGIARIQPTLDTKAGGQSFVAWALDNEGKRAVYTSATATALPQVATKLVVQAPAVVHFNQTVSVVYEYRDMYDNPTRACADPDLVGWSIGPGMLGVGVDSTRGQNGYLYTSNPAVTWTIHPQALELDQHVVHAQAGASTQTAIISAYAPNCTGLMASDTASVQP